MDMEIPRCTAIGYLENLQNKSFNEIYAIDEHKIENEVTIDKPIPEPDIHLAKFLAQVKITVPAEEEKTSVKTS
jgi:hypothetical protein